MFSEVRVASIRCWERTLVSEWPFSQVSGSLVVAHRGSSAERPENTLAAFERAIEVGADAVEFDVRLTADGVVVVVHDADVARTTDGLGVVRDLTLAEVKRLRIAGEHQVPTLEETLHLLSGRIAVDIEIKNLPGEPDFEPDRERVVDATLSVLGSVGFVGPVLLSSFNPAAIEAVRSGAPDVPTGLLTEWSVSAGAALEAARAGGHAWVLPFAGQVLEAKGAFAAGVHDAGMRMGVWITDDPDEAMALMRLGADAVATNDPGAILAARREVFGA